MDHYLTEEQFGRLQRWANSIRGYYGEPVYLVGSVLTKNDFRDVDIRVVLSNFDFGCRYGEPRKAMESFNQWIQEGGTGEWTTVRWKWSDDCVKRSKEAAIEVNLNIDFQVQPQSMANAFHNKPKIRIDTRE